MFLLDSYIADAYRSFFDIDREDLAIRAFDSGTADGGSSAYFVHRLSFPYKLRRWLVRQVIVKSDPATSLSRELLTKVNSAVLFWAFVYHDQMSWPASLRSELIGFGGLTGGSLEEIKTIQATLQLVKEIMDGDEDGENGEDQPDPGLLPACSPPVTVITSSIGLRVNH